jgi:hypothetical protein
MPGKRVGNTFGQSSVCPDTITAVVVHGGAEIPAAHGMWGPGATRTWFFVDYHADARRRLGCAVVIEGSMDVGIGGELRMKTACAKQVQSLQGLGQEFVPKVHWEIWGSETEPCNEMIFKCADGPCGSIAAVDMGRRKLCGNVLVGHIPEEGMGGLVVHALKLGLKTPGEK